MQIALEICEMDTTNDEGWKIDFLSNTAIFGIYIDMFWG